MFFFRLRKEKDLDRFRSLDRLYAVSGGGRGNGPALGYTVSVHPLVSFDPLI